MPVQQRWIHLSVGQTCVHVVAAGYTQEERKSLLSSCPDSGGKDREQACMDMPGSRGHCEDDGSGGGGIGSEPVVKREWKTELGYVECSGTSNLRWKRGRDREVWHERGHSLGLRNRMDMDSVQNVCKDFFKKIFKDFKISCSEVLHIKNITSVFSRVLKQT